MYSTYSECLFFFCKLCRKIFRFDKYWRFALQMPAKKPTAVATGCVLLYVPFNVYSHAHRKTVIKTRRTRPNTTKLTCTCLQLVLGNVPKNLGAISGRSSSSVGILQMARQVTLRHNCLLLTYRPESFEITNVFKL
jgi:hypothetical protein